MARSIPTIAAGTALISQLRILGGVYLIILNLKKVNSTDDCNGYGSHFVSIMTHNDYTSLLKESGNFFIPTSV